MYSWPLRPLITQYLAYDNKNKQQIKGKKIYQFLQESSDAALQATCYEKKISNVAKFFSVRLFNNFTIHKRNKEQQQKWEIMHKSQKTLYENS